jgi:hypothetical protein
MKVNTGLLAVFADFGDLLLRSNGLCQVFLSVIGGSGRIAEKCRKPAADRRFHD